MIEEGRYRGKPVDAAMGHAGTGAEQVGVAFEITEEGPYKGQVMTWYGYFTADTMDRTFDTLKICGWDCDNIYDLSSVVNSDNEVQLVIQHDEYNGKTNAKIAFVNRIGGLAMKDPMNEHDKQAFAKKMRGSIAAWKQKTGNNKPEQKRQDYKDRHQEKQQNRRDNPSPPDDDDIPF